MEEITEELEIVNPQGLHARPAAALVKTVLQFQSEVHIAKNGRRINAKSIMGLLTLAAAQGARMQVICKGPDAHEAMDAVRALVENGFGES